MIEKCHRTLKAKTGKKFNSELMLYTDIQYFGTQCSKYNKNNHALQ